LMAEKAHASAASGCDWVRAVVSRIISKISGIAPIVLAIGCRGPTVEKADPPTAATVAPTVENHTESAEPKALGAFDITFYYVIGEEEIGAKKGRNRSANKS